MDCAIQGDGFFLVGDKTHDIDSMDALKGLTLTRVGNFEFRDGYLTDGQGNVSMDLSRGPTGMIPEPRREISPALTWFPSAFL